MNNLNGFPNPNVFKYVSNQPYLKVKTFYSCNPILGRLLLEAIAWEKIPANVLTKKTPRLLDMPTTGMFYISPLNIVTNKGKQ